MSASHSHFVFLEADRDLQTAIHGQFDPVLVMLSVLVACVAAYTAFLLSERVYASRLTWQRWLWVSTGSVALGIGIWAMHFTGMLALRLPFEVYYDKFTTLISIVPAVLASAVVLFVGLLRLPYRWCLPLQSILMGCGIGLMHYIGMAAMHMDAIIRYDPAIFTVSIIVAVSLSYVSLRFKLWAESSELHETSAFKAMLIASLSMGFAVSAMHYTGMAAIYFFPILADVTTINASSAWAPASVAELQVYTVLMMLLSLIAALQLGRRLELLHRLQDSEIRQASIVENMVDGLIVINEKGIIDSFNPAAEKLFAYRKEDVIGKSVNILMAETEQARHDDHLARYKHSGQSRVVGIGRDIEGRRRDGSRVPIDLALSVFILNDKRYYLGVVRDITQRKQAEANILEAKRQAEKASQAKSEFLNRVSHELRTPMNAILGFSQVLEVESETFSEQHRTYIKELKLAGYHLLELINGMLDLSRIDTDKLAISMDAVILDDVIHACLGEIEPQAKQRNIHITDLIDKHLYIVKADAARLQQVLHQLLANAVIHNHKAGQVTLACEALDTHHLRISVTDSGPGLSSEQQQQLFTPFGRLNNDERLGGTGIGLAISKHLMSLMGGSIGVESQTGVGSTFWIELERVTESEAKLRDKQAGD